MMTSRSTANTGYTQQYAEEQIKTASKEQILIMLFDGAIRFTKVAKKAMIDKDYEKSNKHLIKAQKILTEFMVSLDVKQGGETAVNLLRLYEYYYHCLVQANIKKDIALIDETTENLVDMRNTWKEAIKIAAREQKASNTKRTAVGSAASSKTVVHQA